MSTEFTSLIESARQGNRKSIAALINRSLQSQSISAQAALKNGYLQIMLEGEATPDEAFLVPYIQQEIISLGIPNLHTLQIFGRIKGTQQSDWSQTVSLQAESTIEPTQETTIAERPQQIEPESAISSAQESAIADYLNQTIGSEAIVFVVELSNSLLKITVKTDQLLEGDTVSQSIRESLLSLKLSTIETVQVYKQKAHGTSRYKIKEFILVQEAPVTNAPEKEEPVEPLRLSIRSASRTRPIVTPVDACPPKRTNHIARFIPLAIVTVVFLFASFNTLLSGTPSAADQCQASSVDKNSCLLAFQIAGEQTIADARRKAFSSTEFTRQESWEDCLEFAEHGMERDLKKAEEQASSQRSTYLLIETPHQEIFRGISLIDVQVADSKAPTQPIYRTACVARHSKRISRLLGVATIPNRWPQQPYTGHKVEEKIDQSLTAYQISIVLGGNILFTAIGLFITNMFNLGIRIFSLPSLFQSAVVLGMVETTLFMVLRPSLFTVIPLSTIALLLTSFIVKDLKIDWSSGYRVVAIAVVIIIAVRTLLNWISLGLLFSLL
jgi:hypothetical protein